MRTIKFRAWSKESKEMMLWDDKYCDEKIVEAILYRDDDYIIMQYTGLNDKNGVEIFECDVVNVAYKDCLCIRRGIGSVKYENDGFYVGLMNLGMFAEIEVIGNIYQNPELVRRKYDKT